MGDNEQNDKKVRVVAPPRNHIACEFELHFGPKTTVGALKEKIAKKSGIPLEALALKCQGVSIDAQEDDALVMQCGLRDGMDIYARERKSGVQAGQTQDAKAAWKEAGEESTLP